MLMDDQPQLDFDKVPEPPLVKFENFWKKVDKNGPIHPYTPELGNCWDWIGKIRKNGYGVAWNITAQKEMRAHRASWFMANGPTEMKVLHSCDRPSCVNPKHLREGTIEGNNWEATIRLRKRRKLNPEDVLEIRRLCAEGWTLKDLAIKFKVSLSAIAHIHYERRWKHLLPGFTPPI